jgi:L-asparaginase II
MVRPRPSAEVSIPSIVLRRESTIESRHRVHVAVTDGDGKVLARAGDPEHVTFLRSAAKPLQAVPLVEDGVVDAFGIDREALAVCCGSHGGEPGHLQAVRRLLERAGVPESALACGPHLPTWEPAAKALLREGGDPERIHNNCSGKHAGMLALARHRAWPLEGYERAEHPVQERMRAEVARWTGTRPERLRTGVDGCGVVTFGLSLREMARGFAALCAAGEGGEPGPRAVVEAMTAHPFMVAGSGRLCTRLMEASGGALVVKLGAEGVYCAADRSGRLGVAIKVEDGAMRAVGVALLHVLGSLGLLGTRAAGELAGEFRPEVRNTRGEAAALLEPEFELDGDP